MSQMDKELEAAYAATQARQQDLKESQKELEVVSAQGEQLASKSRVILALLVFVCATGGSGILLADPDSRPWGFLLLFGVLGGGVWSFFRNKLR